MPPPELKQVLASAVPNIAGMVPLNQPPKSAPHMSVSGGERGTITSVPEDLKRYQVPLAKTLTSHFEFSLWTGWVVLRVGSSRVT